MPDRLNNGMQFFLKLYSYIGSHAIVRDVKKVLSFKYSNIAWTRELRSKLEEELSHLHFAINQKTHHFKFHMELQNLMKMNRQIQLQTIFNLVVTCFS